MKTKNILFTITFFTLLSLGLSGCGSKTTNTGIAITAQCTTPDDLSTYQTLNNGDIIAKADTLTTDENDVSSANPQFSIFQADDGTKKVCISSGSAVIIHL